MKKLFLILSLFICFKAFGQTPTSPTPVSQMSWYKDLTGHMWAYRGTTLGWIQMVDFSQLSTLGSVTSITPGIAFVSHVPITTTGTMDIDTALIRVGLARDFNVVHLTGNETIASGAIKTFLTSPIIPNATTAFQPVAFGQLSNYVDKTTTQTGIGGDKTWTGTNTFLNGISVTGGITSNGSILVNGGAGHFNNNTGDRIVFDGVSEVGSPSGGALRFLSNRSFFMDNSLTELLSMESGDVRMPYLKVSGSPVNPTDVVRLQDIGGSTGSISAKLDTTGKSLNTKRDFGVIGDAKVVTDAVVTASSVILTSATANFTTADIGKTIGIPYAGADNGVQTIGNSFITTIASINSTTSINLTAAPIKTIASGRTVTDAAMTAGSNVLTSATATFLPSDVGKKVFIPGAGSLYSTTAAVVGPITIAPYILTAWIQSYTSATQVVLTKKAINTTASATVIIPGAWINYGTDNTTNLQAAVTAAQNQKTALYITAGRYLITSAIQVGSDLTLQGQGMNKTIISPVGTNFAAFSAANLNLISATVSNIKFSDFEVDCFGVTTNTYIVSNKAFNINPARNIVYENLYVHDTGGSGIGTDFMRRVTVEACIVEHCGRQYFEFGANAGGSGLGFGQGVFTEEPSAIRGNFISNCGNAGILIEGQVNGVNSTGVTISGNYLEFNGVAGVGDFGTNGVIINGNNFDYNDVGIRGDKGAFQANTNYSKNSLYTNNIMRDNRIGILTFSLSQGHKISDNKIYNETVTGTTGIKCFSLDTSTVARDLIIENNQIYGVAGPGIDIATSVAGQTFGNLIIKNNELYNNGASTSSLSPGIDINAKVRSLYVKDNIAYDNRTAGNKTQSYGLRINAFTIGQFDYGGNNFLNNATAPDIFTGATITTQITQPTYERAGVFTGAQTFSANTTFGTNSIYDITNTRLGIGTLTPSFMLHIEGASALGLLKRNSATGTSAPKFIMTRTGSTLTTDISANFVLGGFQFRGRVAGVDSDYGQLGYVANTTTVGDGKFSFYKADLTTSVLDVNNSNGSINIPVLTASQAVFTDAGKNLISNTITGTGSVVMSASPTLTGTPLSTTAAANTNTTQIATTAHVFAERTNTATLTNKTLTSPQINTPSLNTTSVVGQVWTATNTAGAGTWTTLPVLIDNILSKTADYTIVAGDFVAGKKSTLDLYVDATAGNVTITLPSATTFAGYTIYVTKTDASVNTVTINTVLGLNTLITQYQERQFNNNGTSWFNH